MLYQILAREYCGDCVCNNILRIILDDIIVYGIHYYLRPRNPIHILYVHKEDQIYIYNTHSLVRIMARVVLYIIIVQQPCVLFNPIAEIVVVVVVWIGRGPNRTCKHLTEHNILKFISVHMYAGSRRLLYVYIIVYDTIFR